MVELIGVEKKILALVRRNVGAGQGGDFKACDQQRPEQAAVRLADAPLAQVGDEDTFLVHHETEVDFAGDLPEHIAQRR